MPLRALLKEILVKGILTQALVVVALALPQVSLGQPEPSSSDPGPVVQASTARIMAIVAEAPSYFEEDPERYFDAIGAEMDQVVDFRGFARRVMGRYASGARVRQLDADARKELGRQRDEFANVLRDTLIKTYSRGLLAFGGSELELGAVERSPSNPRKASVLQTVRGAGGKVYTVRYEVGLYKDGQWRLRNLVVENISLGEIYRTQFEAAAQESDGDLWQVIRNWSQATAASDVLGDNNGSQ